MKSDRMFQRSSVSTLDPVAVITGEGMLVDDSVRHLFDAI